MAGNSFHIQDGLSQNARRFPELVDGFFSVDSTSTQSILETMKMFAREHGSPHFFDGVDLSKVVAMMNGDADGNTDPALALYAVCAKLMGTVQRALNELPDKRIDFYYRSFLKQSNRKPEGDHAIVSVEVGNNDVSCVIPKGTRFVAGENSKGEKIEFESIADTNINDVKVEKILTVSCVRGYPITQSEIPVYKAKQALEQKMQPYPLFGLTRSNEVPEGNEFSKVGLCVSDRIFCMSSGVRKIKMDFVFAKESVRRTVIEKNYGKASDFIAAFSTAFRLSLTTENGWLDIDDYKISCCNVDSECPENAISLEFTLKDTDPSIVNYNAEIHGEFYNSVHPVLRLLVNPRKSHTLWFALMKARLRNIRIAVDVKKCRDLAVSNEYGPASILTAVQPFGSIPNVGSSFIVGCKEICGKKLKSFSVHGKWCGLPDCNGFSEWYSQYDNPPQTSDFVVSLSGLYGGVWLPSDENRITSKLFNSNENKSQGWVIGKSGESEGKISSDFKITFDSIVSTHASEMIPDDDYFMYSPMMKDGFFKMKLIAPSRAFLHQEMSRTVCNSFLSQVVKKKTAEVVPNQPYTPSIEDLYVCYSSYAEVSLTVGSSKKSEGFFFVHPFGYSKREPFFVRNGSLFLGLQFSGMLKKTNFYFMLNRDSATHGLESGKYSWSYLGRHGWKPILDENRLADSTAHFTSSGIVTIDLPNDMVNDSKLMPHGFYWIRITPNGESWRECSRLLTVFAQSLEVKRVSGFENGNVLEHCKPQTINDLKTTVAGISSVYQFEESFGGKLGESDSNMRVRVAESLYHRNRCVCIEDYERIILDEFPEVHKVKCFPHVRIDESLKRCDCLCPGNMLVVPVSSMYQDGSFQWDPCLNGSVLWRIHEFLQNKVSPKTKVQVLNPFFDKLQVRCNVKFHRRKNEGEILLDLNEKINRYLSPWFPQAGGVTKHFGWTLEKAKLKSYIESLDYVESVADDFTVMKIASTDEQKYAVDMYECVGDEFLRGSFPWSIAVPMRKHFINDVEQKIKPGKPSVNNGYGGLEIGQTFIIRKK